MQLLSNLTAVNVYSVAFLESVGSLRRLLVLVQLSPGPVAAFPVEQVPGLALLTAARSSSIILPNT
jgi:hypothetical protein